MLTQSTEVRRGANRTVLLLGRYAFKIPTCRSWRGFLFGLLNNQNEARRGRRGQLGYCPVVWACPGGWLVVMKRAEPLLAADWHDFDVAGFCGWYGLKAEHKPCSFGRLEGRVVAVDYGW